jgi:hypothetical protein
MLRLFIGLMLAVCVPAGNYCWKFWLCDNSSLSPSRDTPGQGSLSGQSLLCGVAAVLAGWKRALVIVQPETVVAWHRAGFKLYWTRCSRHKACAGRKCVSKETRELIFPTVAENPS